MAEFLEQLPLFPIALTISACLFGQWLQSKFKNPLLHPILVAAVLVAVVLTAADFPLEEYQEGTKVLSWLLTPATICLAVPLYQQLKVLKKNLLAIIYGIAAGSVTSLVVVFGMCRLFGLDNTITVSLLPKSITTAMGIVLSGDNGGLQALTTAVIIVTGILGSFMGSFLCKIFKLTDPISQGVAFGTASHVVGTSKANELGKLQGAVSSLSLVVAGILTAILFPLACMLL